MLFVQHQELTETFQTQLDLPLEVPGRRKKWNMHNIKKSLINFPLEKHSYHRFRNFRHNTPLNSPSSKEKQNSIKRVCLCYIYSMILYILNTNNIQNTDIALYTLYTGIALIHVLYMYRDNDCLSGHSSIFIFMSGNFC